MITFDRPSQKIHLKRLTNVVTLINDQQFYQYNKGNFKLKVNCYSLDLSKIIRLRHSLIIAIDRKRSSRWILQLWSRFIRERDLHRCVSCSSTNGLQAHHIVRKTLYPWGAFDTGNGITLCHQCHRNIHEKFNGRPNLDSPIGEGDDQDEWAFLFRMLLEDAISRGLNEDELYYINDNMVGFFVNLQGDENLYNKVIQGKISRIRFAHEIFSEMPRSWHENFSGELFKLNK